MALTADGVVTWNGAAVGRLCAGADWRTPRVEPLTDSCMDSVLRERIRRRLESWVAAELAKRLRPLLRLAEVALSASGRGLAFQLGAAAGSLPRAGLEPLLAALSHEERRELQRLGVRIGPAYVYLPALVKPAAIAFKAVLWSTHLGLETVPTLPAPGRVSFAPVSGIPAAFYAAIGYPLAGGQAVRVDILDRLFGAVRRLGSRLPATTGTELAPKAGLSLDAWEGVMETFGYRRQAAEDGTISWRLRRQRPPGAARPAVGSAAVEDGPFAALRNWGAGS